MLNTISTILFTLSVLLLHTPNVRQQDYNDIDGLIKLAKYASWPDENVPDARESSAKAEAEKKRRLQIVAKEVENWRKTINP